MIEFPRSNEILDFLKSIGIDYSCLELTANLSSMSNSNYLFLDIKAGFKVVLRIDNASNSKVINRLNEKMNSKLLESLGISPKTLFTGIYKISEYISDPVIYDKSNKIHLFSFCKAIAALHNSKELFSNMFDPIQMARDYLSSLSNHSELSESLELELQFIQAALKSSISPTDSVVPCQVDLVPENILYSNKDKRTYIIDQEYSGNFYPEWDLAELASETSMNSSEESELLVCYNIATKRAVNYELYLVCKALCNLLWSAWALYYEENEGGMTDYFNLRYSNYVVARDYYKELITNE